MSVLTRGQAARLARRASRTRDDGTRGVLARWALWLLTRAGEHGNQNARDAVWELWLECPEEDDLWRWLIRWREEASLAEAIYRAAGSPSHAKATRVALGEFCARQGFVPDNPAEHALLLVVTGQAEQHRALDPDGSLLAAAYLGAPRLTRTLLRSLMVRAGDLDFVRVVVGDGRDRVSSLDDDEVVYLAHRFAAREEWNELWRLIREIPLLWAIELLPRFDGWRPDDADGRRLFHLLDQPWLRETAGAWKPSEPQLRIHGASWTRGVSFSPDGTQLATLTSGNPDRRVGDVVEITNLPGGWRLGDHGVRGVNREDTQVLHLGDAVVVAEWTVAGGGRLVRLSRDHRKGFYSEGFRREVLRVYQSPACRLARLDDGFVVSTRDELFLGSVNGRVTSVGFHELGMYPPAVWTRALGSDPETGRFAVGGLGLVLADRHARVIARARAGSVRQITFSDPDRLITLGDNEKKLTLWSRNGNRLVRELTVPTPPVHRLVAVPLLGKVVALTTQGDHWFEQATLAPTSSPLEQPVGTDLWVSPDGQWVASHAGPHLLLDRVGHPELVALLNRPMAGMRPADLATVSRLLDRRLHGTAGMLVRVLHAWLEYGFRTEVEIGTAARPVGEAYDISLGDESEGAR